MAWNGLKSPKLCAVVLTINTQCWWGPLGAIRGHLGPFRGQSEALEEDAGSWFEANFTLFSGLKRPEIPQIYVLWDWLWRQSVGGDHLGVIWGPFKAIRRPQSNTLGADLKPISPFFLVQNGLKYPNLCTLGLTMKTKCWWGKFGAIWGPYGGNLEAI